MFTFSKEEYKWCVECEANIRKDAYYCKLCRKPVGSKLLAAKTPRNVSGTITEAAHWLPNFIELLEAIPAPFRARIDEADAATPPPHIGLKPGVDPVKNRKNTRNSNVCAPNAPSDQELSLVMDILISLQSQGFPLAAVCSDPRLQLLELNVGEIVAEHELRLSEIQNGQKCRHCAEFILNGVEQCRFCTGTESDLPQACEDNTLMLISRYDSSLLRNILIWEAATRRLNNEAPLSDEIISPHEITEEEIDLQILSLRQNPKVLPLSRWRKRMLQLEISPAYCENDQELQFGLDFEYFALADIGALARALTPSFITRSKTTNPQEALVVVHHGLSRWQANRHFDKEHHILLNAKAMVYLSLDDNENYKKYSEEADALVSKSLPEDCKDLVDKSRFEKLLKMKDDPDAQLKDLEERANELLKRRSESMEKMNKLVPGMNELFNDLEKRTSNIFDLQKHALKGESALKVSDYKTACAEFEAAIAMVGNGNELDINSRCGLTVKLADAQFLNGDANLAEATFQRALSDAADITEAKSKLNPSSLVHHRYAAFLRDTGNHARSEEYFQKAFHDYAEQIAQYIAEGFLKPDHSTENWKIKEDYAKLLRAMGRDEEAAKVEAEARILEEIDIQAKKPGASI